MKLLALRIQYWYLDFELLNQKNSRQTTIESYDTTRSKDVNLANKNQFL